MRLLVRCVVLRLLLRVAVLWIFIKGPFFDRLVSLSVADVRPRRASDKFGHYVKLRVSTASPWGGWGMRGLKDLRRVVVRLAWFVIMVEDQAHSVFKVFELGRLNLLNLVIVHFALFHQGIQLLCSEVLKLQAESLSYKWNVRKLKRKSVAN